MDLITGLLLLWGVRNARMPAGPAPVTRAPVAPSPPWPQPASPPPARPAKRPKRVRVVRPAPAPARVVPAPVAPPPAVPAAPVPVPAVAPPPVHTSLPVRDIQTILNTLGASPALKVDNLFGPKTAGAWRKAALGRDLPAYIARVAPQVVEVTTYTLDRLRAASGSVVGIYIP